MQGTFELRIQPQNATETLFILFNSRTINDAERIMIVRMLREVGGNKLEAAKRLGIGRQTLYNKIETYHIEDDELLS